MFSIPPTEPAITNQIITYGDHGFWEETDWNGIDDLTELWWDPTVPGLDEIRKDGVGMYRAVDGAVRSLPGEWNEELKVDRERVVSGKSVYVRVDLGGRRIVN